MFNHVAWQLLSVRYFHLASSVSGRQLHLYFFSSQNSSLVALPILLARLLANQHFIKPICLTNIYSVQDTINPTAQDIQHSICNSYKPKRKTNYNFPMSSKKNLYHQGLRMVNGTLWRNREFVFLIASVTIPPLILSSNQSIIF